MNKPMTTEELNAIKERAYYGSRALLDFELIQTSQADVTPLIAEIERLTTESAKLYQALYERDVESVKQENEIKKLSGALEFYANEDNYKVWQEGLDPNLEPIHNIDSDCGRKARKALEGKE